ncbi:porin [Noviherbaspirillum saxi]|nr:porin [Noviherbaspirillum saxi]
MMKKTLLAATFAVWIFNVHAQGSMTIYGSIDSGVTHISNVAGTKLTRVDSGNRQPDRIGIRGSEDLGGGVKTVFQLENGYVTDTGAQLNPAKLFNRGAYVGIGNNFGTLTFGRQNNFMFDMVGKYSNGFLLGSFYAFHPGNIDDLTNAGAYDNAVKLVSAPISGVTLGAMYALGEQSGDSARNRAFSLGANYAAGPFKIAAALSDSNNRSLTLGQTTGIRTLLGRTLISGSAQAPVYSALATDKVRSVAVSGSYAMGPALLHALHVQTDISVAAATATMKSSELGVNYRITPANSLNLGVAHTSLNDMSWDQLTLNNVYSLSKRTAVYAQALHQRASGTGTVAAVNSFGYATGQRQSAIRIGVHHLF